MADEREELEQVPGEEAVEQPVETPAEEPQETTTVEQQQQDERDRLLAEVRAENERLQRQLAERSSSEGRAATPTTPAVSYEQTLSNELAQIQHEANELSRKEVEEGQTVASINKRQDLLLRTQRVQAAMTQVSLKKQELNIFVNGLPKEQKDSFRAYARDNAHRFADLDAMYDAFEANLLRKASGKVKVAEKIIANKDRGVVGQGVREVSAAEAKEKVAKMTGKQYDERYDQLIREGNINEALELSRRLAKGTLQVDD